MNSHDKGIRLTQQRKVILDELCKVDTHPTADQVYEMVRKRLPRISLGTVYRNLEIMSECGMIRKLQVAGCQKRFDGNPHPHYHARCDRCGNVGDVHYNGSLSGIEKMTDSQFHISGHRLEFTGLCPECRP